MIWDVLLGVLIGLVILAVVWFVWMRGIKWFDP